MSPLAVLREPAVLSSAVIAHNLFRELQMTTRIAERVTTAKPIFYSLAVLKSVHPSNLQGI